MPPRLLCWPPAAPVAAYKGPMTPNSRICVRRPTLINLHLHSLVARHRLIADLVCLFTDKVSRESGSTETSRSIRWTRQRNDAVGMSGFLLLCECADPLLLLESQLDP